MKVDVILPIYKPNRWFFEALNSVCKQTYTNWHITIIDDCTPLPNNMIEKIKQTANANIKITHIRLSTNLRAAGARMEAIKQTSGDIISFIDQDDIWRPEKLKKHVDIFRQNESIAVVHTNIHKIGANGLPLGTKNINDNLIRSNIDWQGLSKIELSRKLFICNSITLVSSSVKRDAFNTIGGFDSSLFGGEDWEFWVRMASQYKFSHISEKLVYRRIHKQNTSSVFLLPRLQGKTKALDKMKIQYPYLNDLILEKEKDLIFQGLNSAYHLKNIRAVCKLFIAAISKHPQEFLYKANKKLSGI